LADTGETGRKARTPVCKPAVVCADTCAAMFVFVGPRRSCKQHEAREERRHGVREHDLADNALLFELRVAELVVPVACTAFPTEIGEWVAILPAPWRLGLASGYPAARVSSVITVSSVVAEKSP